MTHVAVLDIGKTNAKLALVDPQRGAELAVLTRPNRVLPGPPYPHYDTERLWQFMLQGLAALHLAHGIEAISVTTHGASVALLDAGGGLATPILDYEHDGPDSLAAAYAALRPPFTETGSAPMPQGLNLGAQLHWLMAQDASLRDRVAHVVTYPGYWVHRLTGQLGSDLCSLGCHTDLWNPWQGCYSSLVETLGLPQKMAPAVRPSARAGRLLADVAASTGLPADTPVVFGIHDSNASLLPHLRARSGAFAVVSTGTWVVCMAVGGGAGLARPCARHLGQCKCLRAAHPFGQIHGRARL